MNIDINKILDQAKESYDRYFKDTPKLPENHGQDVVFNKEKMREIINEKVNQSQHSISMLEEQLKKNSQERAELHETYEADLKVIHDMQQKLKS